MIDVECNMQSMKKTYNKYKEVLILYAIKFQISSPGKLNTLITISDSLTNYKSNLKTDRVLTLSTIKII